MSKSISKLFALMTLMAVFTVAGLLPVFADGGVQTVPLSPTDLNATATSNTQTYLAWNAPINATQSGVTGYQIRENGTIIVNDTASTQTNFNYTGLLAADDVEYQVAAWNSAGLGLLSNFASSTTDNPTVSPPTNSNATNSSPTISTNSSQTISDTQPTTDQTTLPTTDQTTLPTTDSTTLPTTDTTNTLPNTDPTIPSSVTGSQTGYGTHHYDSHKFYTDNRTTSYFDHMKLDQMISHTHYNMLSNGQKSRTLETSYHPNLGIQTQHVDHKLVSQFVQKSMEIRHLSQDVQKQGFEQHKTQFHLQASAFKQDGIGKINASHSNNIGFHSSSNNIARTSSTSHTFQSHQPTLVSLPEMNHEMTLYKSHLGNNT